MDADISDAESFNDDEFQFETDYIALRGNKDYSGMIKHVIMLEVQKIKAVKDIEKLDSLQRASLADPLLFVEDLKAGKLEFPTRQITPDLPIIDWGKYGMDDPSEFQLKREVASNSDSIDQSLLVRGRIFTQNKPVTFNQLWTCEEQRRLEELLEIYPEEEVEIRRWEKIANALGNRTTTQVMSRVQKYFLKLAQSGLPIPGRAPKNHLMQSGIRPVPGRQFRAKIVRKSTFFPEQHVPVSMNDSDLLAYSSDIKLENFSSDDTKWHQLSLLKMAKEQRTLDDISPVVQALTITCSNCQKSGFHGARWICESDADNVWCTDCVIQCVPLFSLKPIRTTN